MTAGNAHQFLTQSIRVSVTSNITGGDVVDVQMQDARRPPSWSRNNESAVTGVLPADRVVAYESYNFQTLLFNLKSIAASPLISLSQETCKRGRILSLSTNPLSGALQLC